VFATGCAALLGALVGALVPGLARRTYGVRVGRRTPVLVGAVAFAALTWALWPAPALAAVLVVAAAGLLLAPIDLAVRRLPDPLVGAAFAGSAAILVIIAISTGSCPALLRAALAGLLMTGGYLLVALLPGAGLGLGDVKLAGVLGLVLGWLGWRYVLFGAILPHLLTGPVVLVLLLTGRLRRDSTLPFGPALLAGAGLAIVVVRAWSEQA
jgi:leader peptidase (prepilin peptidase)/N-methyltransferase